MAESSKYIPARSLDKLNTANINPVVLREIDRLTKEIIDDTFEALASGITYQTINYVEGPTEEEFLANFLKGEFNDQVALIRLKVREGDEDATYLNYLNSFIVEYNSDGDNPKPNIKLRIDVGNSTNIGDLEAFDVRKREI